MRVCAVVVAVVVVVGGLRVRSGGGVGGRKGRVERTCVRGSGGVGVTPK